MEILITINKIIFILSISISILFLIYLIIYNLYLYKHKNNFINYNNYYLYEHISNNKIIYIYIILIFIIKTFFYEIYYIPSSSMYPKIKIGDFILVKKITNNYNNKRNDIVIFNFPYDKKINYIKRIIGIPKDILSYDNNKKKIISITNINNKIRIKYSEYKKINYLKESKEILNINGIDKKRNFIIFENIDNINNILILNKNIVLKNKFKYVIPENYFFVLGDNRDNSFDSRYWGFLDKKLILGKYIYTLFNIINIKNKIYKYKNYIWIFLTKFIF